jgi:hypothetical protein
VGDIVVRIGLRPFAIGLQGFLLLARHGSVVDSFNAVALAVAHAVAQLKRLRIVFDCQARLVVGRVVGAHGGHGPGKIRIERYGALNVRE